MGYDLGKVNKQAPIKNQMPTRKHESNNNDLRYDGSRYNQNAPPAEDEDTDYQGYTTEPRQITRIEFRMYHVPR